MFSSQSTAKTNSPTAYRSNTTYSTTFSGPIKQDENLFNVGRNEAMAQAEFQGQQRQFNQQAGRGVGAGGKMQAYRSGLMAQAEAAKGYAQAQQEMLNKYADSSTADLQFQERYSGEKNWLQDLLLDRDETLNRERMASFKREKDVRLGDYERKIKEAIAAERRKTEIMSALI